MSAGISTGGGRRWHCRASNLSNQNRGMGDVCRRKYLNLQCGTLVNSHNTNTVNMLVMSQEPPLCHWPHLFLSLWEPYLSLVWKVQSQIPGFRIYWGPALLAAKQTGLWLFSDPDWELSYTTGEKVTSMLPQREIGIQVFDEYILI